MARNRARTSGRGGGLPAVLALRRSPVVRRVAAVAARTASVPVHLVGGMVRDAWLGRATHDLDLVVGGRGEEIAKEIASALEARFVPLGGKQFAAFRLVAEDFELDLWDREGMSVQEDLARRDLTINAIALDLSTGEVVDPFDGLGDLGRRVLRATTGASFTGDPLRVLRLARLLAQIPGFEVAAETRELGRRAARGLSGIAAERIREELLRLFVGADAARALFEMAALDLYPGLFAGQPGEGAGPDASRQAQAAASEMEALPASAARLRVLAGEIGLPARGHDLPAIALPAARWASAVIRLPDAKPVEAVRRLQILGYLGRRTAEPVLSLVRDPRPPPSGSGSAAEQRRALHRVGQQWATALVWWGARSAADGGAEDLSRWETGARELLTWIRDDWRSILDPPRLLGGEEVQELLDLAPGPEVGRALEAVREAQVEGRVRTREEAIGSLTGTSPRTTSSRPPSAAD